MDDLALLRYSRHILLKEVDVSGQDRISQGRVLMVGAGGLGSAASLYLVAAGVGHLTLCDGDEVDLTNLQRQVALRMTDLGRNKALATKDSVQAINPLVQVDCISERLDACRLDKLVANADVVLDCTDNFETRHAINKAAVHHRKPLVSGAAIRFDAQVTVFDLRDDESACYACLFPEEGQDQDERCAIMGVFSPLVGIVGATQAAEALKLLAGIGISLRNRLLMLDALSMEWRQVRLQRDPACQVCGRLYGA